MRKWRAANRHRLPGPVPRLSSEPASQGHRSLFTAHWDLLLLALILAISAFVRFNQDLDPPASVEGGITFAYTLTAYR